MRLIDADALQGAFDNPPIELDLPSFYEYCLKEAPTIEAEPVKYGHWRHSKAEGLPTNRFVCSECDGLVQVSTYRNSCMFKYCPNCGAKMEGESE